MMQNRLLILIAIAGFFSCSEGKKRNPGDLYFTELSAFKTGIDFNNKLEENDSTNFLTNQYIYIGSGVGVADFNQDGLQDIFFAGAQVPSRLYINKGSMKFDDVTEDAGLLNTKWCTGVSIVDINTDGLPDIYVSVTNSRDSVRRKNQLFINKGNLKFNEEAAAYGLDDAGYATQAAFIDFDRDGDLDMYLMNHTVFYDQPNNFIQDTKGNRQATDKFYRNEGVPAGGKHPLFKDISLEAGIRDVAYGLGIVVSDLNFDGWPDIYVANDFISNDLMWINNKQGGFTNMIGASIRHQSYNSMGVDIADLNNDLLPEIAVLDMQPEDNYRKKIMFAGYNPERYEMEQKMGGFQPQFARNMLQWNQGLRKHNGTDIPFYSEIGNFSGIAETDWSWSVLMGDYNNDGLKDIHITNGLSKDLTNNDFLFFRHGKDSDQTGATKPRDSAGLIKELDSYGEVKIDNYLFLNKGKMQFGNITEDAGMKTPSISHGAAHVDLDNDGDLDLVVNNMNQPAFVWRNELRNSLNDTTANFITVQLKGAAQNPGGYGTRINLYAKGEQQLQEQSPVRGYLSSIDQRLHFGLKKHGVADSIIIQWPDGKMQRLTNVKANQFLVVEHKNAVDSNTMHLQDLAMFQFDESNGLDYQHIENIFFDFSRQRLIPQKYSQIGPPLAVADVNGDGMEDLFIGGGEYQWGKIYLQNANGKLTGRELGINEKIGEDAAAIFIDADNDKDQDLVLSSGSSEYGNGSVLNTIHLYKNDGKGKFEEDKSAFPEMSIIAQALAAADFDKDGDLDLFVGGRVLPEQYPLSPKSYLLRNDNGKFTEVTKQLNPSLEKPGLITSAAWIDLDKDEWPDLVLTGDWMPIRFFKNNKGSLVEITDKTGLTSINGMWRTLKTSDIDGDGDEDLLAGNIGLNNKFHPSAQRPMKLFANDFDGNGAIDLVPAYFLKNQKGQYELFPGIDRTQFSEEILAIKKKYLLNDDYARSNLDMVLGNFKKEGMISLEVQTAASGWIENKGGGKFIFHEFPMEAQIAPINSFLVMDLDKDGKKEILIGGNEYQAEVGAGRYDASYGVLLKNLGNGQFEAINPSRTGLIFDGVVKNLVSLKSSNGGNLLVAAINNEKIRSVKIP